MNVLLILSALALQSPVSQGEAQPEPYPLGTSSTAEGAKRTVSRLLEALAAGDDAAFEKVARGIAIMAAPDFAWPMSRAKLTESFKDCTAPHVESAEPFPKMPQAQAVRITMQCQDAKHPEPKDLVMDVMADDEHAFLILPGGVAAVWPEAKR